MIMINPAGVFGKPGRGILITPEGYSRKARQRQAELPASVVWWDRDAITAITGPGRPVTIAARRGGGVMAAPPGPRYLLLAAQPVVTRVLPACPRPSGAGRAAAGGAERDGDRRARRGHGRKHRSADSAPDRPGRPGRVHRRQRELPAGAPIRPGGLAAVPGRRARHPP